MWLTEHSAQPRSSLGKWIRSNRSTGLPAGNARDLAECMPNAGCFVMLLPMTATTPSPAIRHRMSTRQRLLFFLTAWLIVLMPFLFWWNTWFGRALTDKEMREYLNDNKNPRHIQHAIVQLGQRMSRHDPSAARWYGDLVRLASYPREEVRSTDAWVLGQDTADPGFRETLLKMLEDPSLMVRGNAALSLVRFGDSAGRQQIVSLLQPVVITTSTAGRIMDTAGVGMA